MTHNKAGQSVPKVFPSERMFVTATVGGLWNYDEWLDRFKTQQVLHVQWKDDKRAQWRQFNSSCLRKQAKH